MTKQSLEDWRQERIDDITNIVADKNLSHEERLRAIGLEIASALISIATDLNIQTQLMATNYEDVMEKTVQERTEVRASELLEERNARKILGRRTLPPVKGS